MNGFIIFTMSYDTNVTFYHFMIKFVRSGKQGNSPVCVGDSYRCCAEAWQGKGVRRKAVCGGER
jgi:hypothetical protein